MFANEYPLIKNTYTYEKLLLFINKHSCMYCNYIM